MPQRRSNTARTSKGNKGNSTQLPSSEAVISWGEAAAATSSSPSPSSPLNDMMQQQQQQQRRKKSAIKKTVLPWSTKIEALRRFRDLEGECNVPQAYVDPETGFRLGRWVANVRQRMDFLSTEQVEDLNELGFVWTRYKVMPWNVKYDLLEKYKNDHGDTLVSKDYVCPKSGFRLGGWVDRLRQTKSNLNASRVAELDRLGFVWNAYENHWETMFDLLCEYKKQFGHVSPRSREQYLDKPLGQWVAVQRSIYTRHQKRKQQSQTKVGKNSTDHWNSTTLERQQRLEAIGFVWNVRKQLTSSHFATVLAARKKHKQGTTRQGNGTAATHDNQGATANHQEDDDDASHQSNSSEDYSSSPPLAMQQQQQQKTSLTMRMDESADRLLHHSEHSLNHLLPPGFLPAQHHHHHHSITSGAVDPLLGDREAALAAASERMRVASSFAGGASSMIPTPALSSTSAVFLAATAPPPVTSHMLAATAGPTGHHIMPQGVATTSLLLPPVRYPTHHHHPTLLAPTLQMAEPSLYGSSASRATTYHLGIPSATAVPDQTEALLQRCEELEARTAAIANRMQPFYPQDRNFLP